MMYIQPKNKWHWLSLLATVVAVCSMACVVHAAPPAASKKQAVFAMSVISASKGASPKMDPRLLKMARALKPFQGQYNQFQLVRQTELKLTALQSGALTLPGGKTFKLKLLEFTATKRIRYEVEMPHTKMKRSVAPGARTLDALRHGPGLTIISTIAR